MHCLVEVQPGKLSGFSDGTVAAFIGVPYAEAPTGKDRFKPARPITSWEGARPARAWASICYQPTVPTEYGWGNEWGAIHMSEDCLHLNIWAPLSGLGNPEARLPVLFWIHGGGFSGGSPSWMKTDGRRLASRGDGVVVSVTHRLNVFGHLYLAEVAGAGYESSANVGHLDIVLGLEWVRDNIGRFGGDAGNVTIFGDSGGAAKVGCLMAMPAAKGLFHKAKMQSGVRLVGPTTDQGAEYTRIFLTELGIQPNEWEQLQDVAPERLVAAYWKLAFTGDPAVQPGPMVDGHALLKGPVDAVGGGSAREVPLMIGTCSDELTRLPTLRGQVEERLRSHAETLLARYRSQRPDVPNDNLRSALVTDAAFRVASIRLAEAQLDAGQRDVYMYIFSWGSEVMPEYAGSHGLAIPFFFDNVDRPLATSLDASSRPLAARMSEALVAFAKTGNPGWQAYDCERRATMVFDRECRVVEDPDGDFRKAWDGIPSALMGI